MKLAEALLRRADAQKRVHELRERLVRSARIQEGDTAPEDPRELMAELTRTVAELTGLLKAINRTNAQTRFDETRTLTDALAERDSLALEHSVLVVLIAEAAGQNVRYHMSGSNIRYFRTINVGEVQQRADDLARQRRDLDARIQELNWTVDLNE
jgi:hypothetical protein